MHIALVNQWYPPETGGGGVAAHNHSFARACVRLGHSVTVIAVRHSATTPFRQTQEGVTILRPKVPNLYRMHRLPGAGRQYRMLQAMLHSAIVCRVLYNVHRQNVVDVAEFAEVNAEALFWNRHLSRRLAVRCHAPTFVLARYYTRAEMSYGTWLLSKAERKTIRRAHIRTAPSQNMAHIINSACGIPLADIHIIPNAVEDVRLTQGADTASLTPITVLFVGRLERLKGVDALMKAIPYVLARLPNVRFEIVGPSRKTPQGLPYSEILYEQLAAFIQKGQVNLAGFVCGESLERLYAQAQISVVPSLYESFSLTVAQAMMHRLPVIACRVGGIPETLDYGRCGILIEPHDWQALARAIIGLAQDSGKRKQLGETAREHALANYSSEVVARRILDLYASKLN